MKKYGNVISLLLLAVCLLTSAPVSAAPAEKSAKKSAAKSSVTELTWNSFRKDDKLNKAERASEARWTKHESAYRYLQANGNPVKAAKNQIRLITLKGKTYAFNDAGYQIHGWRKIGGNYYYFSFGSGNNGYMLTDTNVDGIALAKSGIAKPSTTRKKKQIALMADFSEWADDITAADPGASRFEKLRVIYDYLRKLPYHYVSGYKKNDPDWDIWGADYVYNRRTYDCHPIAATFAYLAHAIGYQDIQIITLKYWHSFTCVDGKYYDTSLGRHDLRLKGDKKYRKFAMNSYYTHSAKIIKDILK